MCFHVKESHSLSLHHKRAHFSTVRLVTHKVIAKRLVSRSLATLNNLIIFADINAMCAFLLLINKKLLDLFCLVILKELFFISKISCQC